MHDVAEDRRELTTKLPAEYVGHFVRPIDLEIDSLDRQSLEDSGYLFERHVDFYPPHCRILGTDFWHLGRYIVIYSPEIDAFYAYIPQGYRVTAFSSLEEAQAAFDQLAAVTPLINMLTEDESTSELRHDRGE
jgi:hypothetical protein